MVAVWVSTALCQCGTAPHCGSVGLHGTVSCGTALHCGSVGLHSIAAVRG